MPRRADLFIFLIFTLTPLVAAGQSQQGDGNLFRWNGDRWEQVDGFGRRVSVGPDGSPWVVNSRNEIYRSVNGVFRRMPGTAKDIGVGADGIAWIIGTDDRVYRWNDPGWSPVPGTGMAISVDRFGSPWVVNAAGEIYHWINNGFVRHDGRARDIGGESTVWIVGTDNAIYQLMSDGTWMSRGGSGVRVSAGAKGMAWVVNDGGDIYRWEGGTFRKLPGSAQDIGTNSNGDAWIVGRRMGVRPQPR